MRLACCLFKYFPYGGLQRDFLAIAKACQERGHEIFVFVMKWEGEVPPGLVVYELNPKGLSNHQRCLNYTKQLEHKLKEGKYDCVIGFNKMPGLDFYYSADGCFQEKIRNEKNVLYRLLSPRYRVYARLERTVFDKKSKCKIFLLSEREKNNFSRYYSTPSDRFQLLPPGIEESRVATPDANLISNELRGEFSVASDDYLVLMVASAFKTKGLDRSLEAIAALPKNKSEKIHFFVIGEGETEKYQSLAKKLKIAHRVFFLGPREDLARFYMAADLLLHPARNEQAGKVLLEALACGLPVITTDVCGYAFHVERAGAGVVMVSPYRQAEFNQQLLSALESMSRREKWKKNALEYVSGVDLYGLVLNVVDKIERDSHVDFAG
ncbi:MAG: glycosyltransferase family 4 protein [Gammaproteobacteria bacterium]|nr:glycosyltransferase family 4 protein [Gammaproteobacteria bacterium]